MKQAVLEKEATIIFKDVEVPKITDSQVLIKVSKIGICGSDIHAYKNQHPFITLPVVQGHEMSGTIVEAGKNVSKFKVGDRVTIMPQIFCKECYACTSGRYNICKTLAVIGCQVDGCSQEFFAVDSDLVVKLPDSMTMEEGTVIEPAAVGYHAARAAGDLHGKKVLVLGGGTIGNLTAQSIKALGAETVLLSDLCDYRLDKALEVGIDYVVNPSKENVDEKIAACLGADGPDVVFECVGAEPCINQAISTVKKGGTVVVVGVYGSPKVSVNFALVQDREIKLQGVLMYVAEDYAGVIKLMEEGKVKAQPIISGCFPFEQFNDAYQYIFANQEKCIKVLVDVEK